MAHAKFQDKRIFGSGQDDFLKVFTIYGYGGHPQQVTKMILQNLCSLFPRGLHIKFGFDWQSRLREKDG